MTNILIAFAMKEEFAPWRRRRFRPVSVASHAAYFQSIGSLDVYAALVGAGAPDAYTLRDLTTQLAPSLAVVTGVAAGLKPEWRPGDLLVAEAVTGPDGGSCILADRNLVALAVECGAKPAPVLVTLPRIARTVEEKQSLANVGDAADMESLPLMRDWFARGIPALALRVILDAVEMPMTCDFEAAMDAHGQVQIGKILAQLARHPQLLPDFLRLARHSRRCLTILAQFLDRFLARLDREPLAALPPRP